MRDSTSSNATPIWPSSSKSGTSTPARPRRAIPQQVSNSCRPNSPYELTGEQFNLGPVNPIELMSAHNDLIEARHSLLQAKYMAILGQKMIEFYRTSTITLN